MTKVVKVELTIIYNVGPENRSSESYCKVMNTGEVLLLVKLLNHERVPLDMIEVCHVCITYMPEIPQGHLWELGYKGEGRNQRDYRELKGRNHGRIEGNGEAKR